eukprot:GHVO01010722.1.p2 GENE.GHVO01010722.1~~GHVO01010722.1.p2  ORF type:complete len:251 (-),score=45.99 GHVO01010722.1:107-859(-)
MVPTDHARAELEYLMAEQITASMGTTVPKDRPSSLTAFELHEGTFRRKYMYRYISNLGHQLSGQSVFMCMSCELLRNSGLEFPEAALSSSMASIMCVVSIGVCIGTGVNRRRLLVVMSLGLQTVSLFAAVGVPLLPGGEAHQGTSTAIGIIGCACAYGLSSYAHSTFFFDGKYHVPMKATAALVAAVANLFGIAAVNLVHLIAYGEGWLYRKFVFFLGMSVCTFVATYILISEEGKQLRGRREEHAPLLE